MANKRTAAKVLRWHASRRTRLSRLLARIGKRYHGWYEAPPGSIRYNGESMLIGRVAAAGGMVFFDVGANRGAWTAEVLATAPSGAAVHAFEIAPPTFERLRVELGEQAVIRLNNCGLYDRDGTIGVDYFPGQDMYTTPIRDMRIHSEDREEVTATVATGDRYSGENAIDQIDLLKIDTEGAEPHVLRGFTGMLEAGRISVIQFEYGMANIYTRFLLSDYYELLQPLGYRIGKLYPEGVLFKDYEPGDEDFLGPNYVAVHESRSELRRALSGRK